MPNLVVPSQTSIEEALRVSQMSERALVEEYLNYPTLPYGQRITIDKIGILNFDFSKKATCGLMKYGTFRSIKPDCFPVCENPEYDYADNEQVSPAVIISGNVKYQTSHMLWFPLNDIVFGIMETQGKLGRRLLPITVVIDRKDQWMVPLFNLSKGFNV